MNNRELWLKERKTYLGGSDVGAIIGACKYKTALDVFLDKTSEQISELTSEPAYWGNTLEDIVAQEYSKRTAYSIEIPAGLMRHKDYPFIACNIDRWANGGSHILECKTASFTKASEWGEVGTDQIPDSYKCQVAYYSAITGVPRVDIAVLIGGQDFRIYRYDKNEEFETKLIKAAKLFWLNYIVKGIAPKATNAADTAKLFPKGNGLEVKASDIILEKIDALQGLKAQCTDMEQEMEHLKVDIKSYMQDAELLVDDVGYVKATWKNRKGRKSFDSKQLAEENKEIYLQYVREGKASRNFIVK